MQRYHTPAGAQVSAPLNPSLVLQLLPHRHHPLQVSSRPTTPRWRITQLRQLLLSLLLTAKRHRHQKMPVMELVLGLLLCMISMPHNTAIRCKLPSHLSQPQDLTFLARPLQDRASLAHQACSVRTLQDQYQVHYRIRHRLHRHRLLLP
jgi:hypothetical protein